jgi:polysaccharide pyruvyl transferase WcaK-like protein
MNRIFLAGFYGFHNTGDDALLAAGAWGVRQFLAPDRILVNVACPPEFPGAEYLTPIYPPVQRFKYENRLRGYGAALLAKSVVYGGGSLFHTSSGIRSNINQLRLAGKGPHYAVGVALGPFRTGEDERTCADFLHRLEFIGLRDQESFEIARSIAPGVRSEKTFDLAPLLPRAAGLSIDNLGFPGTRKGIGFSLCDYERFSHGDVSREAARREKLTEALKLLDPSDVEELVFIDFNGHPLLGDRKLHKEIAGRLNNRFKIRHVPYCPNPIKMLREIASLRVIVAMRLHAAVFGYLAQTPTIMLSYHPKCNGWASDIGLPHQFVFDSVNFEPEQLVQRMTDTLNKPEQGIMLPLAEAERMALKNWQMSRIDEVNHV